jgi:hypothetical protein
MTFLKILVFSLYVYLTASTKGQRGPGSSVGIATDYGLEGPGIESRWGVEIRTCPGRPWIPPSLL